MLPLNSAVKIILVCLSVCRHTTPVLIYQHNTYFKNFGHDSDKGVFTEPLIKLFNPVVLNIIILTLCRHDTTTIDGPSDIISSMMIPDFLAWGAHNEIGNIHMHTSRRGQAGVRVITVYYDAES